MKLLSNLILLFSLILLQGCFEVLEEVNLNPDGSGTLSLNINGSQSKSQLDKIMSKDTIGNYKVPQRKDIETSLAEISNKLKTIKGISNVTINRDYTNYILSIKCNFSNVSSLNAAINNIWLLYDKKAPVNSLYFTFQQKTFRRSFDYAHIKNLKEKLGSQEKDILSKALYTIIYRFPSEIQSQSNADAVASKSKKATIWKSSVYDIVTGKKNIANEIKIN